MCCGNCACEPQEPPRPENGAVPTEVNEEQLLEQEFGPANADGIYGAVIVE